jgi:hypothetical protein
MGFSKRFIEGGCPAGDLQVPGCRRNAVVQRNLLLWQELYENSSCPNGVTIGCESS